MSYNLNIYFEALSEGVRLDTIYMDFSRVFVKINRDLDGLMEFSEN